MTNALRQLRELGQSVWLDTADPVFLRSGGLARMIEEHGIGGVNLNPGGVRAGPDGLSAVDAEIARLMAEGDTTPSALYEALMAEEARVAADCLMPSYQAGGGDDGLVALEISPYLMNDAEAMVVAAHRLARLVDRPNLVVKLPATDAGLIALRAIVALGISVDATLIFKPATAARVVQAYIAGLEDFVSAGGDPSRVVGYGSVGLARIDRAMDAELERRINLDKTGEATARLEALRGRFARCVAALAAAEMIIAQADRRWRALEARGAHAMRPVWSSTRVRTSELHRFAYLEQSIVARAAIVIRVDAAAAFAALPPLGPVPTITPAIATEVFAEAARLDLPFDAIADRLLGTGLMTYQDSLDGMLEMIARRRLIELGSRHASMDIEAAEQDRLAIDVEIASWRVLANGDRLWRGDARLWTNADEGRWLAWLDAPAESLARLDALESFARDVRAEGFRHVLLLGMGGSSLGPEVLGLTFPSPEGAPRLHVVDSTDPREVAAAAALIDPATTLFIVASKSGGTLEPTLFMAYFLDLARKSLGEAEAARRFCAITDPGSKLEAEARALGFRWLFHGDPEIGGRYSVLSNFGMVPAAAVGVDVGAFLESTLSMARSCGPDATAEANPGIRLGVALGVLAQRGRDKLTILTSPGLSSVGGWLEQLIAESTGKNGRAIIPVDLEPLGVPESYGEDRVFAHIGLADERDPGMDSALSALASAGHPVIRIELADAIQLGQEFFRWEVATAVAGSVMGIHPFDQPDVEASKIKTRALTDAVERDGGLPAETPLARFDGIALFAEGATRAALEGAASFDEAIKRHLGLLGPGDYLGLLAYIHRTPGHAAILARLRAAVRDARRVATCAGFGPRFLHSTGQAYKGGPATGVFLQITASYAEDLPVPGRSYGFGVVEAAQARGDLGVLVERDRRALRIDLGDDVETGLARLERAVMAALA